MSEKIKLGFVVSEFNRDITYMMEILAKEHAEFLGAEVAEILRVPGTFDIPIAIKKMLEKGNVDAVVAIGCVIEGETEHDEIVAQHASRKIVDLSIEYGKPVTLGISGPGMGRIAAAERVDYAKRAVEAAVKLVKRLREYEGGKKD
ncbi:MAG: 6,7-dimethyl-8-ribityllumazine synthase [Archaeoglobaceae archaeon]